MISIILLYLSPLAALAVAFFSHGRNWKGMRLPVYFSAAYLLLQGLSFYYVWYCFVGGYEDWIHANVVPFAVAFFALPTSWIFYFASFRSMDG